MKIVVLDSHTLNPGDLSWSGLEALGECLFYERTAPELIAARAREAEIVFTNKVVLGRAEIAQLPHLRYIGVLATGYNVVDVAAAQERGILVTNIPAYGTRSVAQMTFALLLELTQHVGYHAQTVREGRWTRSQDFAYWDFPLVELEGLTLGIIGMGRIGKAVAELAQAFGMKVIAYNPSPPASLLPGVMMVELEALFKESDVVSFHCPLTAENKEMVNAAQLANMKPTALLVNTSRGTLVDEAALALALNTGVIAGAGLDVLAVEPPHSDNPLLTAKNCLITPHQAWATKAARERLLSTAVDNLRAFMAGKAQNVVKA